MLILSLTIRAAQTDTICYLFVSCTECICPLQWFDMYVVSDEGGCQIAVWVYIELLVSIPHPLPPDVAELLGDQEKAVHFKHA